MGNEMYHWGVKGMRWGVRRYQNADGSLTSEGRKRLGYAEKPKRGLFRKKEKPKVSTESEKPKAKRLEDMSDDELKTTVNRLNLIQQGYGYSNTIASYNAKQISKGRKFVNSVLNDVLAPAAKEAGKDFTTKLLKGMGDNLLKEITNSATKKK